MVIVSIIAAPTSIAPLDCLAVDWTASTAECSDEALT
jgi:hypothetical protein